MFNPQTGSRLLNNLDKVYLSDSPTLNLVAAAYGRDAAIAWTGIQIHSVDLFTQVKEGLDEKVRKELSELITSNYGWLKLTEFLLFIARFKLGLYGKFYGAFDPITFCEAIRKYVTERRFELERVERAEAERKKGENPVFPQGYNSLTWYQHTQTLAAQGDLSAIERLKPLIKKEQ